MVHHGKFSGWFATLLILCCLVLPAAVFAATVSTDKSDYAPGETVQLSGTGWQPGETVSILLHEDPTRSPDITLTPVADGSGNISATHVVEDIDLGVAYTVTATGQSSGLTASTTFTDAPSPGTAPVNPPTGGFGIDGNVQANVATAGIGDWVPGAAGSGGSVLTAAGVPIVPGTTFHAIDLYSSGSDNNFAGGNKFDGNPQTEWTWVSNPVNDKEDLNNGLIHFTTSADGHTWVMVAADRLSNNGDAYVDFEFLQNTLSTTGGPSNGGFSSAGPDGGRTANDFVLTLELTKGGTAANFFVNRWEAVPISAQAPSGFDYVDRTGVIPGAAVMAAVNTTTVPVSYGAFGNTTYDVNTFVESAIDLTALLGAIDKCTSLGVKTILIKTKESQSPTATIVDFISPIQLNKQIGLADAGLDQHKCDASPSANTFTVTGVATPAPGDAVTSTVWTVVPGSGSATISSPNNLSTNVTVTSSTVTLRFTVNTQLGCSKFDDVVLTVDPVPTCSISGPDGPLCPSASSQTYSAPAGMASYKWTISGNGSINGSSTGQTVSVNAGSGCNSSFILTLVVTNDGGCQSTCNKTVNVQDTQAPVIAGVGPSGTLNCPATPSFSTPTASDNCGSATLTFADSNLPATCPAISVVKRTWTATDACGNSATASQTITIEDHTAPAIAGVGLDATIQCPTGPTFSDPTANDVCSSASISHHDDTTPGPCTEAYSVTRTWTAVDACGNTSTAQQTIHVVDTTKPVLSNVPSDATVACDNIPPPGNPIATDACDSHVDVTFNDGLVILDGVSTVTPPPGTCSYQIRRTWTATDDCGNAASATQVLTVSDTQAPTVVSCPSDQTLPCPATPSFGTPTFHDNCDNELTVTNSDQTLSAVCPAISVVKRTWTATDNCGNHTTCSQTITIEDHTAPVIAGVGLDATIQCPTGPTFSDPTANDVCSSASISHIDTTTPGPCTEAYSVTRVWTAVDACGNTSTAQQTIHVVDTTKPVFSNVPSDATVECDNIPPPGNPIATDACDSHVDVTFNDGLVILDGVSTVTPPAGTCSYQIRRTWTGTDDCGNAATATQVLTVSDTQAPTVVSCPSDQTLPCPATPSFGTPTFHDNCDNELTVTNSDQTLSVVCPAISVVKRTWTATDNCGNHTTCSQTITIEDHTAPVIAGVGLDATIQCPTGPTFSDPTANDVCSSASISHIDTTTPGACTEAYSVTRVWTAVDACGNTSTAQQTIHVVDTTKPVFSNVPSDATVECDNIPPPGNAIATDACDSHVDVTFNDGLVILDGVSTVTPPAGTCTYQIKRTWTGTDDCGNAATATQILTVSDTQAPTVVSCPSDGQVECPATPSFGTPTFHDNCDNELTVTNHDETLPATCPAVNVVKRTWTATDNCGNHVTCSQTIKVVDTTAPVLTCPSNITAGACNVVNFSVTALDACTGPVTPTYSKQPGTTFPVGATTVHVSATDACGNTQTCDFTVTVGDNPTVTITGTDQVCQGGTSQFCGPDGNFDYAWTGPGTFTSADKCITVGTAGGYSLTVTDKTTGCTGNGSVTLNVNPLPTCSITGPTQTCANVAVNLCGPDGNYGYVWTGPGSFNATSKCISVSAEGDYVLTTTDLATKCSSTCQQHLTVNQCVTNCPRTPGFWAAQCDQSGGGGKTKFDTAQMNQITSRVDDKVGIFNWSSGTDFAKFCATVDKGSGNMDQRLQAKRQFAAFLANVCTGELGLIANNGDVIKLDLSTPVSCPALTSTTMGGLLTEVDNTLLALEGQSLNDPAVKAKYSQIISCLNEINNAEGVGTVCSSAKQQNAMYEDYVLPAALRSAEPGDLVELYRPSPNPFANSTRIAYVVNGTAQQVQVGIFDIAGRRIRELANGFKQPGRYELNWDGRTDAGEHVVNGVYFIRSIVAGQVKSMQVVVLR